MLGSIYISSDNGNLWKDRPTINTSQIKGLTVSDNGIHLAMINSLGEIIISNNSGQLWTKVNFEEGLGIGQDVSATPNGRILIALSTSKIYISQDYGFNWKKVEQDFIDLSKVVITFDGSRIALVSGAYKSKQKIWTSLGN